MPKAKLGQWAGWLFVAGFVLLAILIIAYNTEALGGAFEQGTGAGKALWVVAAISAVATLITGAVSWLRFKDHSVVVIQVTIYGVLATTLLSFGATPQR
jgi:hypothetical protein